MSDKLDNFMQNVRICLIDKVHQNNYSCTNGRSKTVNDHVDCFVKSNYCELGFMDKMKIATMVPFDTKDPISFVKIGLSVSTDCLIN